MTEFGNVALVEEREENEGGTVTLRLPGVRSGDMASRSMKPEIRVYSLQFSPTGIFRRLYKLNFIISIVVDTSSADVF